MPKVSLVRREKFSASHRLYSKDLSESENQDLFGKCAWPHGHGHNYGLEVEVRGELDPKTGLVMNLTDLKEIIQTQVLRKVDHRHLNLDVPEFQSLNPTAENIAIVVWHWLRPNLPPALSLRVKIEETDKNSAIYSGD